MLCVCVFASIVFVFGSVKLWSWWSFFFYFFIVGGVSVWIWVTWFFSLNEYRHWNISWKDCALLRIHEKSAIIFRSSKESSWPFCRMLMNEWINFDVKSSIKKSEILQSRHVFASLWCKCQLKGEIDEAQMWVSEKKSDVYKTFQRSVGLIVGHYFILVQSGVPE